MIEVQGAASSGKTHLVYHTLATCILPEKLGGQNIGGWDKAAVVLDTDGTFDIGRFYHLLDHRLRTVNVDVTGSASPNKLPELTNKELISSYLKKLHVFRPTSSIELAATLINLPMYHLKQLPDDEIALIVIDSISAFYWPDRFTAEQMQQGRQSSTTQTQPASLAHPLHNVLVALERFRSSHAAVVLLTNWGLSPLPGRNAHFFRQHLQPFPTPFIMGGSDSAPTASSAPPGASNARLDTAMGSDAQPGPSRSPQTYPRITHHITLAPQIERPLAANLTLDEALEQEIQLRSRSIRQRHINGLVRMPGFSSVIGQFSMQISKDWVHMR